MSRSRVSRRAFLEGAAALGLVVVPRHVLGGEGQQPPSETLNIASIGVGGKGSRDVRGLASQNIVALCDVDERQASRSFKRFPKAKKFTDYRVMLEELEREIDAVTVSTPDHSHAPASMMAVTRGKHCFTQKPLTHDIAEARALADAARSAGVATMMGIQHHCKEDKRFLCEWIWAGKIGQVTEAHVWTNRPIWPQGIGRPKDTPPVPKTLDWNLWLGPAPERPYHPAYVPDDWRGWWDFGTGALGDMGCHIIDGPFWALKLGEAKSVTVEAESGPVNDETYPKWSIVTYQFPARGEMGPVKLVWYDGKKQPPRPKELAADRKLRANGQILVGEKATMFGSRVIPESTMREMLEDRPPKTLPRSPGIYKEFIRACKGGEPCGANWPDYAGRLTEIVLLGNLAIRMGEPLEYDIGGMRVTNVSEANRYLRREYREGWSL
jgi:predicted dehydrogenase